MKNLFLNLNSKAQRQPFMRKITISLLFIPVVLSSLAGCASKYGEQKTSVNYYPACYRPIQDLRESEHNVAKGTATGGIIGALGGALTGLLATGKWEGAVMGGALGGVAGSVAGNIYASKQQVADDNRRLASYLQDIDGDISNLDVAQAAARTSLQCYDQQFKVLVADIKARKIARDAAQQRFAEISAGREEAIAILGDAYSNGANLAQQYQQAFVQEEQQIKTPQKLAQGRAAYAQKQQAINTAKSKQRVLAQKTESISREKAQAESNSSAQLQDFREALADIRA